MGTATAEGLPYYDFGLVCTLDTHYPGPVYAVAWSRDGRLIASASRYGQIAVHTKEGSLQWAIERLGPDASADSLSYGLSFSPDGRARIFFFPTKSRSMPTANAEGMGRS